MKYLFILFTFFANTSFSQDLYHKLDSTTKAQINLLSNKNKKRFDSFLLNRSKISLDKRIDSIEFDYLFIEESFYYSDSSIEVKELYFCKNDTIPKLIVGSTDIEKFNEQNHFLNSSFNLNSLLNSFSNNSLNKRALYSKKQTYYTGCVPSTKREFRHDRKKELKTTFQIQSLVSKADNSTKVSIQLPPKHPRFKVVNGGYVW